MGMVGCGVPLAGHHSSFRSPFLVSFPFFIYRFVQRGPTCRRHRGDGTALARLLPVARARRLGRFALPAPPWAG